MVSPAFFLCIISFSFFDLSYSICVRPEAGYDCVRWQVRVQNCYINHENQFNAISLIFRFALTSHVGRRLVTVLRYQMPLHALGTVLERQQMRTNRKPQWNARATRYVLMVCGASEFCFILSCSSYFNYSALP